MVIFAAGYIPKVVIGPGPSGLAPAQGESLTDADKRVKDESDNHEDHDAGKCPGSVEFLRLGIYVVADALIGGDELANDHPEIGRAHV